MLRLLWKEFHEAKWHLLSLLLLPWAVILWCTLQMKVSAKDASDLAFWVCMLPLAFLASTRVQKDLLQPNHLSVQWLPVNRWVGFAAKFAPGLVVAILIPIWIRFVATACTGDHVQPEHIMEAVTASIYAFTFAASIFLPSLPAALVGVAFDMIACGWTLKHLPPFISPEVIVSVLALVAATASMGVWARPGSSSIRRRASAALKGIAVGVVPALAIGLLLSVHMVGGPKEFRAQRDRYQAVHKNESDNRSRHEYTFASMQVSPDGRSVAYVRAVPGGVERTMIEISEIRGGIATISDSTASPAGWLRNGDLLVYTGTPRTGVHLNRYYRSGKRLVELATFPPCGGQSFWERPILSVVPNPSDDRVALLVMPPSGGLPDLWVVDARTGNPKLIRRSIKTKWSGDHTTSHIAWSGDSIIMVRQSEYWRIPLDGSRPKYITNSGKEVRRG